MTVTSTTDEGTRSGGWRHWLSTVLPRPCLGCAAEVGAAVDTLGLCLACRGKLRNASADACTACGRSATAAFAAGETPQLCPSR